MSKWRNIFLSYKCSHHLAKTDKSDKTQIENSFGNFGDFGECHKEAKPTVNSADQYLINEQFEERAAIMEYDGGLSRDEEEDLSKNCNPIPY